MQVQKEITEPTEKESDAHIDLVTRETVRQIRPKYLKGQKEHGIKPWEKNIIPLIKEELTEFNISLPMLIEQVENLVAACDELLEFIPSSGPWKVPLG